MTFKELVEGLNIILKNHPELANREISHASECGYSEAGFESPVQIAVPIPTEEYSHMDLGIRIVSNDDGYRTNRAYAGWNFISLTEE